MHGYTGSPPQLGFTGQTHISWEPSYYSSIIAGTWALIVNYSYHYGLAFYNTTAANNDEMRHTLWIDKGTWTLSLLYTKGTNFGILDIELDGVSKGTIDCYAATSYSNIGTISIGAITAGIHTIDFKVNGKNGSSSGYYVVLEFGGLLLYRTS